MTATIQDEINRIQDIFDEQGYFRPVFTYEGGLVICIDARGIELFRADRDVQSVHRAFVQWCHDNYNEYGIVPF